MIKEDITYKEKFITEVVTKLLPEKEVIITYTCSDGTKFDNKNDDCKWCTKGKELADKHEEKLKVQYAAKIELNFRSIINEKHDNEGYEKEFYFYYHDNLSDTSLNILKELIYDNKYKINDKLEEGWYFVKQELHEDTSGDYYCMDVNIEIFEKLDVYVKSLEDLFIFYKSLPLNRI